MEITNPFAEIDNRLARIENTIRRIEGRITLSPPHQRLDGDLLTLNELSKILRTPKATLYRKAPDIGYTKIGKRLLFKRSDVENYIRRGRISRADVENTAIDKLKSV